LYKWPVANLTPQRLLLALGLAGGLLLVFVTPPFQVPDEPAHFLRIYQVATAAAAVRRADGVLGFEMPESLPRLADLCVAGLVNHPELHLPPGTLGAAWRLPLAPERRAWLPATKLSQHSPFPYLAAAAAVALGRLLALPPLALLYLARLGNLAAALAIAWAAVRIAPVQRWLLALLALTPMAMFLRSSASADALTNALALLLVACLLALALRRAPQHAGADRAAALSAAHPGVGAARGTTSAGQESAPRPAGGGRGVAGAPISGGRVSWLLVTAFLLAAAKEAYCLLALLVFLVPPEPLPASAGAPWRHAARRRAAFLWAGGLAALLVGAGLSWWVAHRIATLPAPFAGVEPITQLRGVLAAPMHFAGLAAADYSQNAEMYAVGFVGNFGWLDTPLPFPLVILWGCLLLAAAVSASDPALALAAWQRCWAAAVLAASLLAISLALYLVWTPLGADFVQGMQGRYLLPLAPVAALLLYRRRAGDRLGTVPASWWPAAGAAACAVLSVGFTVLTLLLIWFRYYGA
jgi:uncharacterized membrane protein